jgi:hypothetical protein
MVYRLCLVPLEHWDRSSNPVLHTYPRYSVLCWCEDKRTFNRLVIHLMTLSTD